MWHWKNRLEVLTGGVRTGLMERGTLKQKLEGSEQWDLGHTRGTQPRQGGTASVKPQEWHTGCVSHGQEAT